LRFISQSLRSATIYFDLPADLLARRMPGVHCANRSDCPATLFCRSLRSPLLLAKCIFLDCTQLTAPLAPPMTHCVTKGHLNRFDLLWQIYKALFYFNVPAAGIFDDTLNVSFPPEARM
jgi:hypothetical protein